MTAPFPHPVSDPGLQANLEYIARYLIPPGLGPLPWPSDTVPPFGAATWRESGWVLLDGTKYKIVELHALFRILGTKYNTGGEGSDEFRVPDMRGRVPVGMDNIGGTDAGRLAVANTLGLTGGAETVTLTSAQSGLPAHSHPLSAGTNILATGLTTYNWSTGSGYSAGNASVANNTAADAAQSHNNMPPYILTYYIMKA